ncbi:MAG: nucleotidyltransferase domain-containing protein [Synergistaceae bacterium]|nr:nucleotidyltransferase domain-containing protein [Synergistaceae bacterium]
MEDITLPRKITLDDKEIFDDVVKAILSVLGDDVVKIILYGSVARGDNTWESDVDIAVLTKRKLDWREEDNLDRAFTPMDLKYDTLFSILTIDEKRFYEWLFTIPLYFNIDEEGIELWTKKAA